MDRRTLITISLSFLILALWQKFYLEPRMPAPQPTAQTAAAPQQPTAPQTPSAPQATAPGSPSAAVSAAPQAPRPTQTQTVETKTGPAVVGDAGAIFVGWNLSGYRKGIAADTAHIDLSSVTNHPGSFSLAFDDPALAYLNQVQATSLEKNGQTVTWVYEDANISLRREISSNPDQPYADVRIIADFKTRRPAYAFFSLASKSYKDDPEAMDRQLFYWTNETIERVSMDDAVEGNLPIGTNVKYIGASNRYFVVAAVAQGPVEPKGLLQPGSPDGGKLSLVYPVQGNSLNIPVRVYFGPKELDLLRSVEPKLDHTVDFGWFTVFAYPLLKLLKWFYSLLHNYGLAIILLTVLIKIVTYPLTYKSVKSMKEMARLQPQLQRLREKHKDDKEALNREMLTMMRTHGYNPMAGCLPILIQMPIFFALYKVLYSSIELYHAPFALWIQDLSSKDPWYVTPILLTGLMYLQQKLSPQTATDPMQQKMMQFMPIMFGGLMLTLPSGLTIYMLINALVSIIQQLMLNKKLDIGNAPAPARS